MPDVPDGPASNASLELMRRDNHAAHQKMRDDIVSLEKRDVRIDERLKHIEAALDEIRKEVKPKRPPWINIVGITVPFLLAAGGWIYSLARMPTREDYDNLNRRMIETELVRAARTPQIEDVIRRMIEAERAIHNLERFHDQGKP